jgi:predicted Zn-dependent peptidase
MMMFDNLFGGSVHSKLFLNVREKLSLAYYAASRYNSLKGFVMVDSGIETKNFELARNEIEHQLNEMKKGNFSDQDIEYSKLAIINSYNSAKDSLASLLNYYSSAPLMETIYEIDEIISHIQAVTKDEIIEAANTVKHCTTFLLKGRE